MGERYQWKRDMNGRDREREEWERDKNGRERDMGEREEWEREKNNMDITAYNNLNRLILTHH